MDIATAARALSARTHGANVAFVRVSTDTRAIGEGDLFVALRGERFDGHDFIGKAFERGAAAALVQSDALGTAAGSLIEVADTRTALGALARFWRSRFALPLAAITGSNGKTTVKEMTAAILRAEFGAAHVLATSGNLNNDIGVPLTLLSLRVPHRVAVIELGMNHRGETAQLAAIARPTIAHINNAQREHLEFMNSVAEVALEHAAVLNALPDDGIAVINADDDHADYWRELVARRNADGAGIVIRDFGLSSPAAIRAASVSGDGSLVIATPEGSIAVTLATIGRHNTANALAACAIATAAGASLDAVARGLAAFRPVAGRVEVKHARRGITVIDDTYNANPDSVRAAIAVLAQARGGRRWLILGDMGEVGSAGEAFHREMGEHARAMGIDRLLTAGTLATYAAQAFGAGARHFDDVSVLAAAAAADVLPGATVLVKGSRFMRMERVVASLTGAAAPAH